MGGSEAFLGIPILGGAIILGLYWPLIVMLVLHIVTLIFSLQDRKKMHGSILGIVTSCIACIPIVGMIMHILSAIFLLIDAAIQPKNNESNVAKVIEK